MVKQPNYSVVYKYLVRTLGLLAILLVLYYVPTYYGNPDIKRREWQIGVSIVFTIWSLLSLLFVRRTAKSFGQFMKVGWGYVYPLMVLLINVVTLCIFFAHKEVKDDTFYETYVLAYPLIMLLTIIICATFRLMAQLGIQVELLLTITNVLDPAALYQWQENPNTQFKKGKYVVSKKQLEKGSLELMPSLKPY